MVKDDPASANIIKPILRGRDIEPYQAKWAGLWLITTFPALGLDINGYPAVKSHLLAFGRNRLEQNGIAGSRRQANNKWYEVADRIAYWEEFGKEKLFWMDMTKHGRFAYESKQIFCNAKGFMITGQDLKYLCAILNSKLVTWYVGCVARTTGMGLTEWTKYVVEGIPVPKLTKAKQAPFITLVDEILALKQSNPAADITPPNQSRRRTGLRPLPAHPKRNRHRGELLPRLNPGSGLNSQFGKWWKFRRAFENHF